MRHAQLCKTEALAACVLAALQNKAHGAVLDEIAQNTIAQIWEVHPAVAASHRCTVRSFRAYLLEGMPKRCAGITCTAARCCAVAVCIHACCVVCPPNHMHEGANIASLAPHTSMHLRTRCHSIESGASPHTPLQPPP